MGIVRQLRWNARKSDELVDNDYVPIYHFLIVNGRREIETIESKITDQLQPVFDYRQRFFDTIPNTKGVMYKYFELKSRIGEFDPKLAYKGRIVNDPKLYSRKKDFDLENYILRVVLAKL